MRWFGSENWFSAELGGVQVWAWNSRLFQEIEIDSAFLSMSKASGVNWLLTATSKIIRNQFEPCKAQMNNQSTRLFEHLPASEMQLQFANLDRHWPSRFDSIESRFRLLSSWPRPEVNFDIGARRKFSFLSFHRAAIKYLTGEFSIDKSQQKNFNWTRFCVFGVELKGENNRA